MRIWFLLLAVFGAVHGQTTSSVTATTCDWSATGTELAQSAITDLRIPKPYSYRDTIILTPCGNDVQTVTMWLTADIRSTKYPAPSIIATFSNQAFFVESYVFPGLTSTALKPGDAITLSWSNLYTSGTTTSNVWGGSGYFSIFVPATAIPFQTVVTNVQTTSTPSVSPSSSATADSNITAGPSTTMTITDSGSGGSTPVGAIAGGVVGGVVLLGCIAGFLFWKLRRPAPRNRLVIPIGEDSSTVAQSEPKPANGFEQGNVTGFPRIRYPEEEQNAPTPSGRTKEEY